MEKQKVMRKRGKVVAICCFIVLILILTVFLIKPIQYNRAIGLVNKDRYYEAYSILVGLGDYKDTEEMLDNFLVVHGKTIEHSSLGENVTVYSYDNNGNCIEEVTAYALGDKMIKNYTYDKNDNCIMVTHKSSSKNTVTQYQYDTYGNLIKEVSNNSTNPTREYYYDINDNLIEERIYYSDGNEGIIEYSYDENNNCVKEVFYAPGAIIGASTETQITEYKYDANNNCIERKSNNYIEKYDYDDNKLIKKDLGYSEIEYIYNDKGICIKEIESYKDGSGQTVTEHSDFKAFYREKK